MALSNLASQLAGLSNQSESGNKNVGSILASSTRHDDAIGRGLHHSVQVGHSIIQGSNPRFKPSVLYEDARAASDITLATLWENCQAALQELTDRSPAIQPYLRVTQEQLLQRTKTTTTTTTNTTSLTHLLTLLSTLLPHDSDNCLHVLEYLVRRYNIHISAADTLLMNLLPHAQTHPKLFHRVLQLVNIAGNHQHTWIWLRPYAGKEVLSPPRHVVIHQIIRNSALLQQVCQWTLMIAKLLPSSGAQQLLAWSATCMVQGLHHLQTLPANQESVLRVLLPVCTAACASTTARERDWTVWGHVVASCLAETMELAPAVQQCLCQSILQGVHNNNQQEEKEDVVTVSDALVAVASVCLHPVQDNTWNATMDTWKECLVVPFPNVLQQMWQLECLTDALMHIYEEREMEIGGLLSSLLLWTVLHPPKKNAWEKRVSKLLLPMKEFWKQEDWTEVFAEWLVWSYLRMPEQQQDEDDEETKRRLYQQILITLRQMDATACEKGMAQAMVEDDAEDGHLDKKRLATLLEGVLSKKGNSTSPNEEEENYGMATQSWLPPRVALEHADPALRLHAIEQLMKEFRKESGDDEVMDDPEKLASLQEGLSRRMASDDDPSVVLAAATALKEILENNRHASEALKSSDVLAAVYQWSSFYSVSNKQKKPKKSPAKDVEKKSEKPQRDDKQQLIVIECLTILGYAGKKDSNVVLDALTAHLEHWNESVAASAAKSIVKIMIGEEEVSSSNIMDQAKKVLVEEGSNFCASLLTESAFKSTKATQVPVSLRRRSLWVMLDAMKEWLLQSSKKDDATARVSQAVVEGCLVLLSSTTEKDWKKNPGRAQSVTDAWKVAVSKVASEKVPRLLVSLASLPKEKVYESLGKDMMEVLALGVKDTSGTAVSGYSVLMEAVHQDGLATVGAIRLLEVTQNLILQDSAKEPTSWHCVVPTLALLEHTDETVRLTAIKTLGLWKDSILRQGKNAPYKSLVSVCDEVSKKQASATLGGLTFLPSCLATAVSSSGDAVRHDLLSLCFKAAVASGIESGPLGSGNGTWIPFLDAVGQIGASVTVLRAMEHAGESFFPLRSRWSKVAAPILDLLMAVDSNVSNALLLLCDEVVGMLKGIAVADNTKALDTIVISSGPSSTGRRQRSYSIGKAEGVVFVDNYPKEMVDAIVRILEGANRGRHATVDVLCKSIVSKVFGREGWSESVFSKFSVVKRRKIAGEFLRLLSDSPLQISVSYFLGLPLDASDISFLIQDRAGNPSHLADVSILSDFVRSNDAKLMLTPGVSELLKTLFDALAIFSSSSRDDGDDAEFVRQSVLSALADLMSESHENSHLQISEDDAAKYVDLLLSLNSNEKDAEDLRPLVSQRAKATSLSVLTKLCASFPKPVVASLLPAIKSHIESMETVGASEAMTDHTDSTFDSIVPVFWKYASHAGLSFAHLLSAAVTSTRSIKGVEKQAGIYASFIRAMAHCSSAAPEDPAMGAVVASYFAGEIFASGRGFREGLQESTEFALQIMSESSGFTQASSILLLLHYADSLLLMLNRGHDSKVSPTTATSFDAAKSQLPTPEDLVQMAFNGAPSSKKGQNKTSQNERGRVIRDLVQAFLLTANDSMSMESMQKCIRRSDRSHTMLCLRLWQDLLIVQSTASVVATTLDDDSGVFAESIIQLSGESLSIIQSLMPLPTFLASATSLIKEGDTNDLRAGAIRLVADRAPEVRPGTPEASLFLEMASLLVNFFKTPSTDPSADDDGQFLLQQSALVAIEHIARSSHEGTSKKKKSNHAERTFMSCLNGCAELFVKICGQGKSMNVEISDMEDSSRKLLCSAALCTATLVRVTAPKCLSLLPKFMNQLISSLQSVNSFVLKIQEGQIEVLSDARIMQVCLLRALSSVAENVPQFIYPFLKQLLSSSAIPSEAMRGPHVDQPVREAAEGLEKTLSANVPARVLLPIVSSAISGLSKPTEFQVLLKVLKESIEASSGAELIGHLGALLKAATVTYDYECELKVRVALVDSANEAVLALVLKLSENHLRRLYAKLREWRGELEVQDGDQFALRRFAFWKVSAVLGKELRTIFLPCLSSVLAEAVDEMNLVVSTFCYPGTTNKTKDGKKKQRLDGSSGGSLSANSMLCIQPLLSCLEFALRADAQDGGKWIRADDGQRYRSILEPLGQLLQSKVPSDFPVIEAGCCTPFQQLLQGGADVTTCSGSGSVIGCLTALASAAGNEQLWKPLNYAVLDACSNRSRSEVRKAGLACLLALMKSLGEEYMVLLPECLPTLAELLEDNDEEVAGLAQDCISLGEELLGESLEDSLR